LRTIRPWGAEEIWALTPSYAAKVLEISAGHRTSLQHHERKVETLRVLEGRVLVERWEGDRFVQQVLGPGGVLHVPAGVRHRLAAFDGPARLVEVSTPELDDVVRHADDYGRLALIAVLARPAVPGATKTRLARAVGDARAARLAAAFFDDTWRTLSRIPWATSVLSCPADPDGLRPVPEVWTQPAGDLGDRLVDVFTRGLDRAPIAVAVGADSPTLPRGHFERLRAALDEADAAFVPAGDGGFVALGLRRCPPAAFAGVRWSSPHAHRDLSERLVARGLAVRDVDAWFDVDHPADLDRLRCTPDLLEVAPATASALREE
jgi:glycosyltransferase A (GT-A) superfamily protein (DUF2064 family)/mannose-6-phosphate isomerase-like protein (cupin superfamily)